MKTAKSSKRNAPPRVRNATATRDAILQSARRAFARRGYDGTGVREIAADAGVTAMLINRYFGSKEELFSEVVVSVMQEPTLLRRENLEAPDVAERFARGLVEITRPDAPPLEGFAILLYSAASPGAADIGRVQLDKHYQRTLASALGGRHADERAGLVFAIVAGVQAMRQMLKLRSLADADATVLTKLLTPLFASLMSSR